MWTPLFRPYVSWRLFPAISLQLLQFFRFCMTLIIMVSMLESYFEAIRYFKKIINYQSEETSCLAYTWDGLVLEVWNIPSISRCDLGHQFPYIKPLDPVSTAQIRRHFPTFVCFFLQLKPSIPFTATTDEGTAIQQARLHRYVWFSFISLVWYAKIDIVKLSIT